MLNRSKIRRVPTPVAAEERQGKALIQRQLVNARSSAAAAFPAVLDLHSGSFPAAFVPRPHSLTDQTMAAVCGIRAALPLRAAPRVSSIRAAAKAPLAQRNALVSTPLVGARSSLPLPSHLQCWPGQPCIRQGLASPRGDGARGRCALSRLNVSQQLAKRRRHLLRPRRLASPLAAHRCRRLCPRVCRSCPAGW